MKVEINNRRKIDKYVEIKLHSSTQSMDQRRNQKGNQKYLERKKNGNITY